MTRIEGKLAKFYHLATLDHNRYVKSKMHRFSIHFVEFDEFQDINGPSRMKITVLMFRSTRMLVCSLDKWLFCKYWSLLTYENGGRGGVTWFHDNKSKTKTKEIAI